MMKTYKKAMKKGRENKNEAAEKEGLGWWAGPGDKGSTGAWHSGLPRGEKHR